ncbi:MAG TPA: hypothetical protein VJ547_07275, partial [Candidatus Thermoplasmatota archaeon]|nr:hypothetical protein [Candidatus Thermoplasmatota archaeon]
MVAPPSKTLIKLADGRTIAVATEDAARYEYYSEAGKVMRRAKGLGGAPSPKPATKDPFATDPLEFGRAKVPPVAAPARYSAGPAPARSAVSTAPGGPAPVRAPPPAPAQAPLSPPPPRATPQATTGGPLPPPARAPPPA